MDACPLTLPPVSNQTSNLNSSTTPRGLGGHLTACIVGAGIDNLFRQVALFLFSAVAYTQFPNNVDMAKQQSAAYGAWALILFSLPFVLLAPLAGSLGDRYPKHLIIRAARIADVPIAALGIWGFAISSPTLMLSALAAIGTPNRWANGCSHVRSAGRPRISAASRRASRN